MVRDNLTSLVLTRQVRSFRMNSQSLAVCRVDEGKTLPLMGSHCLDLPKTPPCARELEFADLWVTL